MRMCRKAKNFLVGLRSKQNKRVDFQYPRPSARRHHWADYFHWWAGRNLSAAWQTSDLNPIRYAYPGVHNPGSYDLWIQFQFKGKTNLVCNWSRQIQINSSLP